MSRSVVAFLIERYAASEKCCEKEVCVKCHIEQLVALFHLTLTLNLKNLQVRLVVYMIFMLPVVLANHVQNNVLGTLKRTSKEVWLVEPDYEYLFPICYLLIKDDSTFHLALTSAFFIFFFIA